MKESLTVRLLKTGNARDSLIFGILSGEIEPTMLNLPSILSWPEGDRKLADRTWLILRAGFEALAKEEAIQAKPLPLQAAKPEELKGWGGAF